MESSPRSLRAVEQGAGMLLTSQRRCHCEVSLPETCIPALTPSTREVRVELLIKNQLLGSVFLHRLFVQLLETSKGGLPVRG